MDIINIFLNAANALLSISRLCTISGRGVIMHPTPAMQALIEQIYHIFRRYPAPQQFVVCCEYCLSQQEQKHYGIHRCERFLIP